MPNLKTIVMFLFHLKNKRGLPFHICPSCGDSATLREFIHCISCNTMVCGNCGDDEKYGHICGKCLEMGH